MEEINTITEEMVMEVLQEMKLRPNNEEDHITLRYKMFNMVIYVMDDGYVRIHLPNIYDVDNDHEKMTSLFVCNKLTRESRHVKVWLNEEMDNISLSSEFYAESKEGLKYSLQYGLDHLAVATYIVRKEMRDYLSQATESSEEVVDQ